MPTRCAVQAQFIYCETQQVRVRSTFVCGLEVSVDECPVYRVVPVVRVPSCARGPVVRFLFSTVHVQ